MKKDITLCTQQNVLPTPSEIGSNKKFVMVNIEEHGLTSTTMWWTHRKDKDVVTISNWEEALVPSEFCPSCAPVSLAQHYLQWHARSNFYEELSVFAVPHGVVYDKGQRIYIFQPSTGDHECQA